MDQWLKSKERPNTTSLDVAVGPDFGYIQQWYSTHLSMILNNPLLFFIIFPFLYHVILGLGEPLT